MERCIDCDVEIGAAHDAICEVARCQMTGLARMHCLQVHDSGLDVWSGQMPGEADCERLGFVLSAGTLRIPDVERLPYDAVWDVGTQRWEHPRS